MSPARVTGDGSLLRSAKQCTAEEASGEVGQHLPGVHGVPAVRCAQSVPNQPLWHLQKPMLHSPCPTGMVRQTAGVCTGAQANGATACSSVGVRHQWQERRQATRTIALVGTEGLVTDFASEAALAVLQGQNRRGPQRRQGQLMVSNSGFGSSANGRSPRPRTHPHTHPPPHSPLAPTPTPANLPAGRDSGTLGLGQSTTPSPHTAWLWASRQNTPCSHPSPAGQGMGTVDIGAAAEQQQSSRRRAAAAVPAAAAAAAPALTHLVAQAGCFWCRQQAAAPPYRVSPAEVRQLAAHPLWRRAGRRTRVCRYAAKRKGAVAVAGSCAGAVGWGMHEEKRLRRPQHAGQNSGSILHMLQDAVPACLHAHPP